MLFVIVHSGGLQVCHDASIQYCLSSRWLTQGTKTFRHHSVCSVPGSDGICHFHIFAQRTDDPLLLLSYFYRIILSPDLVQVKHKTFPIVEECDGTSRPFAIEL